MAVFLLLLFSFASLFVGVIELTPASLWSDPEAAWLLAASRLPRVLSVLLTGTSLAIAGLVMQVLVQNRFVEPATAGSGQSAVLGIILVTLFIPGASLMTKMGLASVTALLGTGLFLLIVRRLPVQETYLVPLVGIVYGGVVGAVATWLAWQADLIQLIDIWLTGEFSGMIRGRYDFLWIAGALAVFSYFLADQFTIASLGEDQARNLGLNYNVMMAIGLVLVSIVTAVTVVTVGVIPFIGLIVPNIVSRWRGDNLRHSLPLVAYSGAMLTLLCDVVGRVVIFPYEVPVGSVFGVVGAFITLWLLYSSPSAKRA
ncbi:ABC transporter permease [Leucothrix arctica]|uniref:Iron ABC transporter permease n=1 Tax=Leucothrix arctica TaxID=1481894 RepID=A0A317C9V9_9GAMM|nr:iron chelate uptake ABC transporter family permease subunit [Leucothrix arctica]PWQ95169.1 iron ABC transporter permease [Leucothrix arctica]